MTFLDTHITLWLYDALSDRFTVAAEEAIDKGDLYVSPMVVLELAYLKEINRLKPAPEDVISTLKKDIGLKRSLPDMNAVIDTAIKNINWTRDPFDRLITAEAALHNAPLVTTDRTIRKHYSKAIW